MAKFKYRIIYIKYGLFERYLVLKVIKTHETIKRYGIMKYTVQAGLSIPVKSFYRLLARMERENLVKLEGENKLVILTEKGLKLLTQSEVKIRTILGTIR